MFIKKKTFYVCGSVVLALVLRLSSPFILSHPSFLAYHVSSLVSVASACWGLDIFLMMIGRLFRCSLPFVPSSNEIPGPSDVTIS